MNDCYEWKTEKHHECKNIAQLQMTGIMMAAVADLDKRATFMNFKAA
jgi:hypothetical protein